MFSSKYVEQVRLRFADLDCLSLHSEFNGGDNRASSWEKPCSAWSHKVLVLVRCYEHCLVKLHIEACHALLPVVIVKVDPNDDCSHIWIDLNMSELVIGHSKSLICVIFINNLNPPSLHLISHTLLSYGIDFVLGLIFNNALLYQVLSCHV